MEGLARILLVEQRREWHMAVSVQDIVGTKWNDMPRGQNMMSTTLHHPANFEIVCVEKRRDSDTKKLLASNLLLQGLFEESLLNGLRFGTQGRMTLPRKFEMKKMSVLMVGTGENTTGYVPTVCDC